MNCEPLVKGFKILKPLTCYIINNLSFYHLFCVLSLFIYESYLKKSSTTKITICYDTKVKNEWIRMKKVSEVGQKNNFSQGSKICTWRKNKRSNPI